MLKKMRLRFTGAAMTAFAVVILLLMLAVNFWNYASITRQQDQTLEFAARPPQTEKSGLMPPERFSPEMQHMMRFFSVSYDFSGNLRSVDRDRIASVSAHDAVSYADKALRQKNEKGYIGTYRYRVYPMADGVCVVFLNSERELQMMRSLLLITALVAVGCLLAVFALVWFLSDRAITPYLRNIETQKRFITDASHELKTPLTAIATSVDVLFMEQEDNEWVQNIRRQLAKMKKLIVDMVTLSRLDEERPFPEMADFSLSEAVWEISEPAASLAKAKGKTFSQSIEEGLVLRGDRAAVQQMVSILLENAVKHSDENGAIRLEVKKAGRKTQISVHNTCPHCEEKDLDRLFDRFYRADSARSSSGYGIGLSIARSVAENHGGTIRAESRTGCDLLITVRI